MPTIQTLFTILIVLVIWFWIRSILKGLLYDGLKEDYDKNCSQSHSFFYKYGIHYSIPRFINETTENELLTNASKIYNKFSLLFWISLIVLIILSLISK